MKNKVEEKLKNVEQTVNEWFLKTIHETIIQTDTVLHKKFHDAKDELIKLLHKSNTNEQQPIEENK